MSESPAVESALETRVAALEKHLKDLILILDEQFGGDFSKKADAIVADYGG